MIGGRILDPSALAALVHGNLTIESWLAVAPRLGLTLWVPELARVEVETLYPRTAPALLALLAEHPHVLIAGIGVADAAAITARLDELGRFDAAAAVCVHMAAVRDWPVLTADPGRLTRIDPAVTVEAV